MPNNYLLSTYTGATPPGTAQYTYDAHGNMLQMPHLNALNWDYADQLKSSEKTGETTHYVYSGGERIRKVVVDTTSTDKIKYERIYLGGYELYRKYDSSENLDLERETHKVMDDQRMIALLEVKTVSGGNVIANGSRITKKRYQYTNHLDSACLELNGAAQVLSYEEYHPFGTTSYSLHTNDTEVSVKRYRYVHKERDDETGLYYYGARYYAPWLCRFVSVDPLKDDYPYLNVYNYAGNKPVTHFDIDGMQGTGDTPIFHTTVSGDTYSGLEQKYGVSVAQLRTWNGYEDTKIPIGTNLLVKDPNSISYTSSSTSEKPTDVNYVMAPNNSQQQASALIGPLLIETVKIIKNTPKPAPPAPFLSRALSMGLGFTFSLVMTPFELNAPAPQYPLFSPDFKLPDTKTDNDDDEIKLFRSMKSTSSGGMPATGESARTLGVRLGPGEDTDIDADKSGQVHPLTGGMSVAPISPYRGVKLQTIAPC